LHIKLTERSSDDLELSTVNIGKGINGQLGAPDRIHPAREGLLPKVVIKSDDSLGS
jgi:hypothetical protein